ncbi:MAG: YraN family protein [Patescibacteria group bacterium]|nr:YraN family protein [Patescibacteria group bacterium]
MSDGRRQLGEESESCAVGWLIKRGFEIVERNFRTRFGEVDVLAVKDEVLHLVEVRSRNLSYFEKGAGDIKFDGVCAQSVGKAKLRRITMTGQTFAAARGYERYDMRILVIEVNWYNSSCVKIRAVPVY